MMRKTLLYMKITPSSSLKKPTYPALLAIAAVGAMVSPASARNEAEKPPVPEAAKAPQQVLKAPGVVAAPREPQRVAGKWRVRPPQARAGVVIRRYPKEGRDSAKPPTPPEKK